MKSWIKYLIISVITLALLEVTLRIYDGIMQEKNKVRILEAEGFAPNYFNKPNFIWSNRAYSIRTNSYGMHWPEVDTRKKAGILRVGLFGDSFTFGEWASDYEHSFAGIAQENLGNDSIEILNFGCGGYGFHNMRDLIKVFANKFNLDWVILCSVNANDFRDTYLSYAGWKIKNGLNTLNLAHYEKLNEGPYIREVSNVVRKEGRLLSYLEDHSKIVQYLCRASARFSTQKAGRRADFKKYTSNELFNFGFWSSAHYPEKANNALTQSIRVLEEIDEWCDAHRKNLAIVTIPYQAQVYAQLDSSADFNVNYPQKHLEDFSKKKSLPYMDLLPILRSKIKDGKPLYLRDDPHFTNEGHEHAGKASAGFIKNVIQTYPRVAKEN